MIIGFCKWIQRKYLYLEDLFNTQVYIANILGNELEDEPMIK